MNVVTTQNTTTDIYTVMRTSNLISNRAVGFSPCSCWNTAECEPRALHFYVADSLVYCMDFKTVSH